MKKILSVFGTAVLTVGASSVVACVPENKLDIQKEVYDFNTSFLSMLNNNELTNFNTLEWDINSVVNNSVNTLVISDYGLLHTQYLSFFHVFNYAKSFTISNILNDKILTWFNAYMSQHQYLKAQMLNEYGDGVLSLDKAVANFRQVDDPTGKGRRWEGKAKINYKLSLAMGAIHETTNSSFTIAINCAPLNDAITSDDINQDLVDNSTNEYILQSHKTAPLDSFVESIPNSKDDSVVINDDIFGSWVADDSQFAKWFLFHDKWYSNSQTHVKRTNLQFSLDSNLENTTNLINKSSENLCHEIYGVKYRKGSSTVTYNDLEFLHGMRHIGSMTISFQIMYHALNVPTYLVMGDNQYIHITLYSMLI